MNYLDGKFKRNNYLKNKKTQKYVRIISKNNVLECNGFKKCKRNKLFNLNVEKEVEKLMNVLGW